MSSEQREREREREGEREGEQVQVEDEAEEVWQNQSFIPFRGWGKPFSLVKEYTDRSGAQALSNDLFPSVPLPEGWIWTTDWAVDLFGSFGAVDKDGWCYGVTWDGLFESIQENKTVGENMTSYLCRRRRWIRIRKCISMTASELVNNEVEEKLDVMVSLEKCLFDKTQDYEDVMQYEQERKKIFEQVTSTCLADILVVYQSFLEYDRVLKHLQSFLKEQSEIEREYADKLSAHATKFATLLSPPQDSMPAVNSTKSSEVRPKRSASMAIYNGIGDSFPPVSSVGEQDSNNAGITNKEVSVDDVKTQVNLMKNDASQSTNEISTRFFASMNKYNSSGAQKFSDYSNFVGKNVIEDVNELLGQLDEQLKVTKKYVYWSDLKAAPILGQLESSVILLQYTYFSSAKKIKAKLETLNGKIFADASSSSSAQDKDITSSSRRSSVNQRRSSLHQRRSSVGLSSEGESTPSRNFPLPSSVKIKADEVAVMDMWTCMKAYRKNVIALGNELSLLGLMAQKCIKKEKEYGLAVRHLFIASAQVLSHEKARICMEMGEIMNKEIKQFVSDVTTQESLKEKDVESSGQQHTGDATLIYTPATELPKFHNQILLMSIMQYTSLSEAKRITQLENDPSSVKPIAKDGVHSIKAVVTTDGVLHIFLLEDKEKRNKKNDDDPYRSLLLENCKIVRHFGEKDKVDVGNLDSSFENAVEIHPRCVETEWFGTSKKNEAIMLIPIDSMESETWVDVLTNPALCGADMLYAGLDTAGRRSSNIYSRRGSSITAAGRRNSKNAEINEEKDVGTINVEQESLSVKDDQSMKDTSKGLSPMTTLFPSVDIPSD